MLLKAHVLRVICTAGLVWLVLTACTTEIPTLTPTRGLSGPTIAPSEAPFVGPPSEAPPDIPGGIDPTAAALPRDSVLPPLAVGTQSSAGQRVEVTAEDGALLVGELYQTPGERLPGVLLLGTDRTAWGSFPEQLNAAGFTVLVMELREGSTQTSDFRVMIEALASGMADPGSIGVVGAGRGADIALVGCAEVETCDAAALLSPLDQAALLNAIGRYNPRPLYQVASQEDVESFSVAQALDAAATGDKLLQPLENAGRGTAILLNRADVAEQLVTWLQRALVVN